MYYKVSVFWEINKWTYLLFYIKKDLLAFPEALCDPQFWHCNVKIYCPDHFSCISLIHFCDLSRTEWINAVGGFFSFSFFFALFYISLWKMSCKESEKIVIFADIPHRLPKDKDFTCTQNSKILAWLIKAMTATQIYLPTRF